MSSDLKADRVLADSTSLGVAFARLAELDDTNCLIIFREDIDIPEAGVNDDR